MNMLQSKRGIYHPHSVFCQKVSYCLVNNKYFHLQYNDLENLVLLGYDAVSLGNQSQNLEEI